jgi:DNA-binding GntR family transcriptional regulator
VSPSKHELAYEAIKARILSGSYGPGYRLVLDALARELGVSTVPVREAIRRLEAEGWIHFTRNVGAQVIALDAEGLIETVRTLALLEGYATALAAPHVTPDDLVRARALNAEMRRALDPLDPERFSELNREFHAVLYERCPNDYLVGLVRQAWQRRDAISRSVFFFIPRRTVASVEEHDALVELVEREAPAAEIESAAREHRLHTVNAFVAQREARERKLAETTNQARQR